MKKSVKKIISMLLVFIFVFSTMTVAFAVDEPAYPLKVEITTNRNSYSTLAVAKFRVKVTNISQDTVNNISVENLGDQLAPLGSRSVIKAETESLAPGASIEFSFKVTLNKNTVDLSGIQRSTLGFKRMWYKNIKVVENGFNDGRIHADTTKTISFGKFTVIDTVRVWYKGINLTTDKTEVMTSNGNQTAYFYAASDNAIVADSMVLIDLATNTQVAVLLDDGMYSYSGDDIPNDGIYSGKVDVASTVETTFQYYALQTIGTDTICSNVVEISVIAPFTDAQIAQMGEVDSSISGLITSDSFKGLSNSSQVSAVQQKLNELADAGLIVEESVKYDSDNNIFSYTDCCGVLGGVDLNEWDPSSEYDRTRSEVGGDTASLISVSKATNNEDDESIGTAELMYAFDTESNPSFRRPEYQKHANDWTNAGLKTVFNAPTTISEYQTALLNENLIVLANHGSVYKSTDPAICTVEAVSDTNSKTYSADLKQHRIAKVGGSYWILPGFFKFHYGSNGLKDSIVYLAMCCGFGEGGTLNYNLSSDILSCGAAAVFGYHNSVISWYNIHMVGTVVSELLDGHTTQAALNTAKATWGNTDGGSPAAYAVLAGDVNATLVPTGIMNGSFEDSSSPIKWKTVGDVRVLSKLAELIPTDKNRMAIITTGLGSAQSEYIAGTEGSIMRQAFIVPDGTKSISFSYDVVSEEPMEYVGSSYDDTFSADLLDSDGNVIAVLAGETVNTSTWYAISGINFEGGDSTTYHTTWKSVTNNSISNYIGERVTVRFRVWDKGDSIFDTAALIDNVVLG